MTKLLDQAIEKAIAAAKELSPQEQDDLAHAIIYLVTDGREPEEVDPEILSDLRKSMDEMDRGEFATDEEVEAAFRSFDEK